MQDHWGIFLRRKIWETGGFQSFHYAHYCLREQMRYLRDVICVILTGSSCARSRYTNRRAAVGTVLFMYELFDWYINTWQINQPVSFINVFSTLTEIGGGWETVLPTCCSFSGCVTVGSHSRARWTRPRLTSLRENHCHTNTVTRGYEYVIDIYNLFLYVLLLMHIYSTSLMYWELIMSLRFIFSLNKKQYMHKLY